MASALAEFWRTLLRASTWRLALRGLGRQPRRSGIVIAAIAIGLGSLLFAMAIQYGMFAQMVETAIRTEIGDLQVHARNWRELTQDPPGGKVIRDPDTGALTGVVLENAQQKLRDAAFPPTETNMETAYQSLLQALQTLASGAAITKLS